LRSRGSHHGGKGGCELRGDAQHSSRLHRRVFRVSFKFNNVSLWDAVFYLLRSGRAWRMLPREYQPWKTVYYHFRRLRRDGWLRQAHDRLRAAAPFVCGMGRRGLHGSLPGVGWREARVACGGAPTPPPAAVELRAKGEAAWLPSAASPMGSRKDDCLVGACAPTHQRLRAATGDGGGHDSRGDEPHHAPQARSRSLLMHPERSLRRPLRAYCKTVSKNGRGQYLWQLFRNPSGVFPQHRIRVIRSHLLRLLFETCRLLSFQRSEGQFSHPYVLVVQHALRQRIRHFREVAQRCCCCDSYHRIGAAGSFIYGFDRFRSVDNAC
jgi:transposase